MSRARTLDSLELMIRSERARHPKAPIIVTVHTPEQLRRAQAAGATWVLLKPRRDS